MFISDLAQARPGKLEMALNVQDVVRTALLPGYIVLSRPAIARGAMLIKNRVPVGIAIGCGCISLSLYFSFQDR